MKLIIFLNLLFFTLNVFSGVSEIENIIQDPNWKLSSSNYDSILESSFLSGEMIKADIINAKYKAIDLKFKELSCNNVGLNFNGLTGECVIVELINNGQFNSNILGWYKTGTPNGHASSNITYNSYNGGSLRYYDAGNGFMQGNIEIKTIPGRTYRVQATLLSITTTPSGRYLSMSASPLSAPYVSSNGFAANTSLYYSTSRNTSGIYDFNFTAESFYTRIQFGEGNSGDNVTDAFLDNFSVKDVSNLP